MRHSLPLISRFAAVLMICIVPFMAGAETSEMARLDAIREFAALAPALETVIGPGPAKYQVVRLNARSHEHAGHRYGVVQFKLPSDDPYTLVMLFADVGNIVEYEIMSSKKGIMPLRGNTRLIYPALADHDETEDADPSDLTLPKPWDHFELHLLGFGPELLKPGEEYLVWFRFADKQPADVLLAATLLKGAADIAAEKLPMVFGLPEHKDE
jgi:hypothetical protein